MKTKRRLIKKWWNEFGHCKTYSDYCLKRLGAVMKQEKDGRIAIQKLLKYAYKLER